MTERKPRGLPWESWVDRQIREATERGDFEDLPGKGKPVADLDKAYDELWWVKQKLRRENLSYLPPALAIRKEVEDAYDRVDAARSEPEVRRIVADVNDRVREVNSRTTTGPRTSVMPIDVDAAVQRWREATESRR